MSKRFASLLVGLTVAAGVAGCAHDYVAPARPAEALSAPTATAPADTLKRARQVLVAEGFAILSADERSGTLATDMKRVPIGPAEADCGSTWGLDYLTDNRVATRVAYGIVAHEGRVDVRATIEADWLLNDGIYGRKLTCVSRGVLERELLQRIAR